MAYYFNIIRNRSLDGNSFDFYQWHFYYSVGGYDRCSLLRNSWVVTDILCDIPRNHCINRARVKYHIDFSESLRPIDPYSCHYDRYF